MITCPKCQGKKFCPEFFPAFPNKKMLSKTPEELSDIFKCFHCGGTGKVPKEMLQWIKNGEILKNRRIEAKITIRNGAKINSILPSILSEMERGIRKPNVSINYDFIKLIKL